MCIKLRVAGSFLSAALLFSVPSTLSQTALNEPSNSKVPDNATAKTYGSGWDCDSGYRQEGSACEAIVVPENAYPTNRSYGSGWSCERGYLAEGPECIAINLPANAYLLNDSSRPSFRNCTKAL